MQVEPLSLKLLPVSQEVQIEELEQFIHGDWQSKLLRCISYLDKSRLIDSNDHHKRRWNHFV